MENDRILYIDENITNSIFVEECLKNEHIVLSSQDPTTTFEHITEFKPDLILLDVSMPEIYGYDLCKHIRKNEKWNAIPIIFLTSMTELDDRLSGYNAGGDSYITKPFDTRELISILKTHLLRKRDSDTKAQNIKNLRAINWSMLKSNSEIGELLRFSQGIANLKDETPFLDHLFATLGNLNLTSTILLRITSGEIIARSDGKPFTLIEKELLDLAHKGNRITSSGNKYLFRSENIILLIRNMPMEDKELQGRLKDLLCILLDSAEASIQLINMETDRRRFQKQKVNEILKTINTEFNLVVRTADQIHGQASSSIENLAITMEHAFAVLDLTEDQETHILKFIEHARSEVEHQHELKTVFKHSMTNIVDVVEDLRSRSV